MKNFEYYKKDLNELIDSGAAIICAVCICKDHQIHKLSNCSTIDKKCPYHADLLYWLFEEYEQLDEVEKRYLGNIVRPFKDKVEYIKLCSSNTNPKVCQIIIRLNTNETIFLPKFETGTMYRNMEHDVELSLEELGLV